MRIGMIVLCVVGTLSKGVSGGYLYDADVHRALLETASVVSLWELDPWHPLFGKHANGAHQHGQGNSPEGKDSTLMSREHLKTKYESLPPNSTVIFDGFALLQATESILGSSCNAFRQDLKHVAFLQYPFSIEPDASPANRDLCRSQEDEALRKMDFVVGASNCTLNMFRKEYPLFFSALKTGVIEPVARFKEAGNLVSKSRRKRSSGTIKFLCVSNTVPRKNILLLFKALKYFTVQGMYLPWQISIVANEHADRTEFRRLQMFAKKHALPVVWLGEVRSSENMTNLYLEHDIFIHASNIENYCMAASEAVCCGCVVVSTAVGEIPAFSKAFRSHDADVQNAFLYEPNDIDALKGILERLLSSNRDGSGESSFLQKCSARAVAYAQEIALGNYEQVFLSEKSFQTRWVEVLQKVSHDCIREKSSAKPDPSSVRNSHFYYLSLNFISSLMVIMSTFNDPELRSEGVFSQCAILAWLVFAVTSFLDMYIFRRSGCRRLMPYIVHHFARLYLYWMLYLFPDSDPGWYAAVLFNVYNFWLSMSVISFGLGNDNRNRPFWWRHFDLLLYTALMPQRLYMYLRTPQFQTPNYFGVPALAWLMACVEIGNFVNKVIFWQARAASTKSSEKKEN